MIQFVTGDLLQSKAQAIAHGVAPNDDFKKGLASSIREQWPSLYKDFRHYCQEQHPKEGTLWAWKGVGGPVIFNLFTQEHPSSRGGTPGKAELKYVTHVLKDLAENIKTMKLQSVALPKIATGVGGLDWKDVKPLIEKYLGDVKADIVVYENYKK